VAVTLRKYFLRLGKMMDCFLLVLAAAMKHNLPLSTLHIHEKVKKIAGFFKGVKL